MKLQRISYGLFEHELDCPFAIDSERWHQLDGEVTLELADGRKIYISWVSEPSQYCIGTSAKTHFNSDVLKSKEMTTHPYWHKLVGTEIETRFLDRECQVFEIRGGTSALYLSSQYDGGEFYGDCVRVSQSIPL